MGSFVSVFVPCPNCQAQVELRTGAGDRSASSSCTLQDAPTDVLVGVNHRVAVCPNCAKIVHVDVHMVPTVTQE